MRQVLGIAAVVVVATVIYFALRRGSSQTPAPTPVPQTAALPSRQSAPPVVPTPGLVARDNEDDRTHPELVDLFPDSNTVSNWVKIEPVQPVGPDELSGLLGERADVFQPYRIRLAAAAEYARRIDGATQRCTVEIIEAETLADAYGMLTVWAAGADPVDYGVIGRKTSPLEYHIWQDRLYVHVKGEPLGTGDVPAETVAEAVNAMAAKILFDQVKPMPVVYPEILNRFPRPNRVPDGQWIVRGLASLDGPAAAGIPLPPEARELVGRLLMLSPDTLMAIVAYNVPDALRPNYVWAVQYQDPRQANQAFSAYYAHAQRGGDPQARLTLVDKADATHVIGTWTAEEESLSYVLLEMTAKTARRR